MAKLYEAVLDINYNGKQCVNRWNYVMDGTPAAVQGSFALIFAMGAIPDGTPAEYPPTGQFAWLRSMLVGPAQFIQMTARAIYDVTDFYSHPFPTGTGGGNSSGLPMSPFNALGFRTSRVRQDIDRGTRRFVGVSEAWANDFGELSTTAVTAMTEMAARMSANLTYDDEGNTLTFRPVIVKKEKYTTPAGNPAYRYYPPAQEATQMANLASGFTWSPYPNVRTQNSRK